MNKSHRVSIKESNDLLPSASKKKKKNNQSQKKGSITTAKELSFRDKQKQEKIKPISTYSKKQKLRVQESKNKKQKVKTLSLSPSKINKKLKQSFKFKQNKNQFRHLQRKKMLNDYLKNRSIECQKQKQLCNESTQFFLPLTHTLDKQNHVKYVSQFIQSEESYFQQDIPSQVSASPSFSKRNKSINLKQSHIITQQQWQNYETLKLKNEELTNYIQELEKLEKKLVQEKKQQQIVFSNQNKFEKEQLIQEHLELNEKFMKTSSDNATLRQMFNEGQSTIQALKNENETLVKRIRSSSEEASHLKQQNDRLLNDSKQLKGETVILKKSLEAVRFERDRLQEKYQLSCSQKEKIKTYAQEMLIMIKKLQINRED